MENIISSIIIKLQMLMLTVPLSSGKKNIMTKMCRNRQGGYNEKCFTIA
jgi:hypothetical protein